MDVTLPNGQVINGVPDGTTKAQLAQKLQANGMDVPKEWLAPPAAPAPPRAFADTLGDIGDAGKRYVSDYASGIGNAAKRWGGAMSFNPVSNAAGAGEAALNTVTGILSNPLALAAKMSGNTRPTADIQKNLTYQPRGEMGQAIVQGAGAITKPVNDIGELSAKGLSAITPMNPDTASAVINTGLMAYGARGSKPTPIATSAEAAQRAQAYVRNNTSLDWTALPNAMRERLADLAKNQKNLDALDPKAIERQIQLESLPAPITNASKGQLTRDPRQLQQEELLKSTDAGQVLTQDALSQNRTLMQNLDILKQRTAGEANGNTELGRTIQDKVLRARLDQSQKAVSSLYEKAKATEPDATVSAQSMYDLLDKSPEIQHLGFMQSWLKKAGVEEKLPAQAASSIVDASGRAMTPGAPAKTQLRGVKLAELDDLRKKASGIAASGGTDGFYAGQVVKAIDEAFDDVPTAANAWKNARDAFKNQRQEFGDQSAIARLVENKSRTDRQTALEDTYQKTVISGSLEDLQKVKTSLQNSPGGTQALRDLAAQTVQNIKEAASKGASNQAGEANATYNNLSKAIKAIGDDKLTILIGKQATQQLRNVLQAAETLKTEPTGIGVRGSNTVNKLMNILDRTLVTKIPVVGDLATGIIKGASKLHELGKTGREVRAAQARPLDIPKEYPDLMTPQQKMMAQRAAIAASLSRANQ